MLEALNSRLATARFLASPTGPGREDIDAAAQVGTLPHRSVADYPRIAAWFARVQRSQSKPVAPAPVPPAEPKPPAVVAAAAGSPEQRLEALLAEIGQVEERLKHAKYLLEASNVMKRLKALAYEKQLWSSRFLLVERNYYSLTLEQRRAMVHAPSIHSLCKSIIFENTQCKFSDCSDKDHSRYYCVVLQYTARFHTQKFLTWAKSLKRDSSFSKAHFSFRVAPEDVSERLTGFGHNAVTPLGMLTDIPIVMSHTVPSDFFFLGGGHVDVKWGVSTAEFVRALGARVVDVTYADNEPEVAA
eukprot:TRINITY_DN5396_c0_g1_i1.p1 TRINITY_DN5396_c0_g1~~TRINITY_DN5396_c0_g1_i1.p1  ORF type:complete len:311 (-),score=64.09 TRINITY_DN5396_c0_g1_i1:41-943(-)